MRVRSKLITVVLCIIIISLFSATAHADKITDCNGAGKIWCGSSGETTAVACTIGGQAEPPTTEGTKSCVIKVSQRVVIPQDYHFSFDVLEIEAGTDVAPIRLQFVSEEEFDCTPTYNGGTGGFRQLGDDNGGDGGSGGKGGETCKLPAQLPVKGSQGAAGIPGQYIGAAVHIYAKKLILNGELSVSGGDGNPGGDAWNCHEGGSCTGASRGAGGGGGSGGNGAGILYLNSNVFEGTGLLNASGGTGGVGGDHVDEDGRNCKGGDDHGGSGGGGGGGGAGQIFLSQTNIYEIAILGGQGGLGGCSQTSYAGKQGLPNANGDVILKTEDKCSDGIDNDGDSATDMEDRDCYYIDGLEPYSEAEKYRWDTGENNIIRDLFATESVFKFNPSATNGSDGVCGDDIIGVCVGTEEVEIECKDIEDLDFCEALGCGTEFRPTPCEQGTAYEFFLDSFPDIPFYCLDQEGCEIDENPCGSGFSMCFFNQFCTSTPTNCEDAKNNHGCDIPVCADKTATVTCNSLTTDYDCRNELFNCEWKPVPEFNPKLDLGYVSKNKEYACFDNLKKNLELNSEFKDSSINVVRPGNDYVWRNANNNAYEIMQAGTTQYISNNKDWYYCNADGVVDYLDAGNVAKHGTFNMEFPDGMTRCTLGITTALHSDNFELGPVGVDDCDSADLEKCKEEYKEQWEASNDPVTFCYDETRVDKIAIYKPYVDKGNAKSFDSVCKQKCWSLWNHGETDDSIEDDDFSKFGVFTTQYKDTNGAQVNLCSIEGFNGCDVDYSFDFLNSDCVGENRWDDEACKANYDPGNSCTDEFDTGKVCDPSMGQYCEDGNMKYSDGITEHPTCCVGEVASCKTFEPDMCDPNKIPGADSAKPDGATDEDCKGYIIGDTDCCVGGWDLKDDVSFYVNPLINESFICYQDASNNYFKECCDSQGECYNKDNALEGYNQGGINKLYSLNGRSLHTLIGFDDELTIASFYNPEDNGNFFSEMYFTYNNDFFIKDWTNYDYLEFTLLSESVLNPEKFEIQDSQNGVFAPEDIYVYSQTDRSNKKANKIVIPISEIKGNIDITDVSNIYFKFNNPLNFMMNDFVLTKNQNSGLSDNWYCSGPFKSWINNLDGPVDSGYLEVTDEIDAFEKIKYEFACDADKAYKWSGNACCGDDTRFEDKEFFIDEKGVCWDGTLVRNNRLLSIEKGKDSNIFNYVLFFEGKVQICDKEVADLGNPDKSYKTSSGTKLLDLTETTGNAIKNELFSVKGNWLCTDEGWVENVGVNRIKLLGNELSALGAGTDGNGDFTMLCSDELEAFNVDSQISDKVDYSCSLRKGTNANIDNAQVVLGFVMKQNAHFTDVEDLLKTFEPFIPEGLDTPEVTTDDVSVTITCEGVSDNPKDTEFFKECSIQNAGKGTSKGNYKVYYNKPFNLVLLSSGKLTGDGISNLGFFTDFWASFKAFFSKLFSPNPRDYKLRVSFDKPDLSNFYVSEQGVKSIVGSMYDYSTNEDSKDVEVRVEYEKLQNSAEFLAIAIQNNKDIDQTKTQVDFGEVDSTTEYIHIKSTDDNFNWKTISSMLRMR